MVESNHIDSHRYAAMQKPCLLMSTLFAEDHAGGAASGLDETLQSIRAVLSERPGSLMLRRWLLCFHEKCLCVFVVVVEAAMQVSKRAIS